MLKPKASMKTFENFGFKKCRGKYGKQGCYYLCVARGMKMMFVSEYYFCITDWDKHDPRIHKHANCRYSDKRDYLEMVYDMIKMDMLEKEGE